MATAAVNAAKKGKDFVFEWGAREQLGAVDEEHLEVGAGLKRAGNAHGEAARPELDAHWAEAGHRPQAVLAPVDLGIGRQEHAHIVPQPVHLARQRAQHVCEPPRLGEWRHFWRDVQEPHGSRRMTHCAGRVAGFARPRARAH